MPQNAYACATCAASTSDGIPVNVREGDMWAADDPGVTSHPGLFSDTPPAYLGSFSEPRPVLTSTVCRGTKP